MDTVVGLLSDSHSRWERTKRALEALRAAGATVFVHCGDVEDELVIDQLAGLDSHLVWGNCDWNSQTLGRYARDVGVTVHGDAGEVTVDGRRIVFTHGHEIAAMRAAVSGGADYLVHGHTHELRSSSSRTSRAAGSSPASSGPSRWCTTRSSRALAARASPPTSPRTRG
jgi:putative phosphoesterase